MHPRYEAFGCAGCMALVVVRPRANGTEITGTAPARRKQSNEVKRTCHFALQMSAYDPKRTLNAGSTVANAVLARLGSCTASGLRPLDPGHHALIDHLRRDRDRAPARSPEAQVALRIARAKLDDLQGLALRAEREPAFSV